MTNNAAVGYMIMSAKALKIDQEMIEALELVMEEMMDLYTESEAEEVYRTGAFQIE
jgi:uncharacterized membrane protein YqiK